MIGYQGSQGEDVAGARANLEAEEERSRRRETDGCADSIGTAAPATAGVRNIAREDGARRVNILFDCILSVEVCSIPILLPNFGNIFA